MFEARTDAKVVSRRQAAERLAEARVAGRVSVLTNGVFDLLHLGHVRYLQEARSYGELLVVGINDDDSVRRLKGPLRPLVPVEERALMLSALECVDLVVAFAEDTAAALVADLQPAVYVKGGDYDVRAEPGQRGHLPESRIVAGYGGRVKIVPFVPAHSTSDLIQTIVERYAAR